MTVELAIQTMTSHANSIELATWAEREGLAAFAVADHFLMTGDSSYALDQLTLLGAVAERTDRIALATLVSPITFRHPAVMLKAAVTLDEISNGRFSLGIGAGWMEEEHIRFGLPFPAIGERFDRLAETLAYLHAARTDTGFDGRYYQLAAGEPPQPVPDRVRIVVGGSGKRRTPQLAGRYADEFNLSPTEESMASRIERARSAAADAGRDPTRLTMSTAFPLVVEEDSAALDRRIEQVAADRGVESDRIRERWPAIGIPVGVVGEVREQLAVLEAEGIERVYFQVAFDSPETVKRLVGLLSS